MPRESQTGRAVLGLVDALVTGEGKALGEGLDAGVVADAQPIVSGRSEAGGTPPPHRWRRHTRGRRRPWTSSARARLDEVRRRLEAGAPAHAARGEETNAFSQEPAGGLGGITGVGVVREHANERAAAHEPEGGEKERSTGSDTRAGAGAWPRIRPACRWPRAAREHAENRICGLRDLVHSERRNGRSAGPS